MAERGNKAGAEVQLREERIPLEGFFGCGGTLQRQPYCGAFPEGILVLPGKLYNCIWVIYGGQEFLQNILCADL